MTHEEIEQFEAQMNADFEDALTHGLYVEEVDEVFQSPYYSFLVMKEAELDMDYSDLYGQWLCDEDYKQSMRNQD